MPDPDAADPASPAALDFTVTFAGRLVCEQSGGLGLTCGQIGAGAATGSAVLCNCGNTHDATEWLRRVLSAHNDLQHCITLAGGGTTTFIVEAIPGQHRQIDLRSFGVPPESTVLRVIQTAQDRPWVHLLQDTQVLGAPGLDHVLHLYGVNVEPEQPESGAGRLAMMAVWSATFPFFPGHDLLVSALAAFGDHDFKRAVLDAHTALDLALEDLVLLPLHEVGGLPKETVRRLPFASQLAILELVCGSQGRETLSTETRRQVAALTKLRNTRSAHGGAPLTHEEAVKPIAAAVSTLWWLWINEKMLRTALSRPDLP